MLNILLVESNIELVPEEIWGEKQVIKYARKRGKHPSQTLLDSNYHYIAMRKLENWEKRGRPDIIHFCLVNGLYSILNKMGKLRIFIHTYNDEIIFVKPETRIPKHYDRFKGLMEQLLIEGAVPNQKNWLLKWEEIELNDFLKDFDKVVLMDDKGEFKKPIELAKDLIKYENPIVLIGGFPKGDFREDIKKLGEKVKIWEKPLTAWTTMNEVIINYETLIL